MLVSVSTETYSKVIDMHRPIAIRQESLMISYLGRRSICLDKGGAEGNNVVAVSTHLLRVPCPAQVSKIITRAISWRIQRS